jgi:capsular exopolysaccharide synthesis family protein
MNGALAGLVIAGIFLLVYIITFRTVLTSRDLRSITNVSYLGTLPVYRKKKRRKSEQKGINILKKNIQSDYLEAVRVIRTRLDRKMEKGKKVLMVTSSLPGEGKSTVSVNLALSFAMQKKKVVLIDCDLRNPSVKEVLNLTTNEPGLAKFLMGECKLQDTLISYESSGLKLIVLPGSEPDEDEHTELLRSENMKKLVDKVKEIADIVVLDTPPSAMLADAEMAVPYADLAVYVVLCDYARTSYIQKGIRELSETGVEIAGIVLNAGKESSSSGYSSYGKKSYYA